MINKEAIKTTADVQRYNVECFERRLRNIMMDYFNNLSDELSNDKTFSALVTLCAEMMECLADRNDDLMFIYYNIADNSTDVVEKESERK